MTEKGSAVKRVRSTIRTRNVTEAEGKKCNGAVINKDRH